VTNGSTRDIQAREARKAGHLGIDLHNEAELSFIFNIQLNPTASMTIYQSGSGHRLDLAMKGPETI
jgi:hypothetical protein